MYEMSIRFNDAGHFDCPYCLLKQTFAKSRQAREYAQAIKKVLLAFMDEEMIDGEKYLQENKRVEANGDNQSKVSEENVNITCGDGKSKGGNDFIFDKSIHIDKEHNVSNGEKEKTQEEETEAFAGSKSSSGEDGSLKMHEHGRCNAEEEKIPKDECETSSASNGDSEVVSVHSKRIEQSDKNKQTSPTVNTQSRSKRSSSALITDKVLNNKVKSSRRLKQPQQPSVKLATDAYGSGKCKRRLQTEREEEELRAGVENFSNEPTKNIPWRKILGLGQHMFDGTRAPSDLKDKWRSICNRVKTLG
ncbi:hypothetical protein DH2020_026722 [Rehmannia glutinosa]|uniref:Myb-like domain-containing protein n=1 Tax=Rehmannia glutinosa TaxID=99300 RepID=A0ABR0VX19_REHGL